MRAMLWAGHSRALIGPLASARRTFHDAAITEQDDQRGPGVVVSDAADRVAVVRRRPETWRWNGRVVVPGLGGERVVLPELPLAAPGTVAEKRKRAPDGVVRRVRELAQA